MKLSKKQLLKKSEEEDEEGEEAWEDMNMFEKVMFFIEFPLDFLRKITMPVNLILYIK